MLVPKRSTIPPTSFQVNILNDNCNWAKQWVAKDPDHRTTVEVTVDGTLKDFEDAARTAAGIAKGRTVILFTGHGVARDPNNTAESSNARSRFNMVPESSGFSQNKYVIDSDLILELPKLAVVNGDGKVTPRGVEGEASLRARYPIERLVMLINVGRALRDNGVCLFVALTCKIASDQDLRKGLVKVLGVPVATYGKFVVTQEFSASKKTQIWMSPTHDLDKVGNFRPDPTGDDDHPSYHEVPTDAQVTDAP